MPATVIREPRQSCALSATIVHQHSSRSCSYSRPWRACTAMLSPSDDRHHSSHFLPLRALPTEYAQQVLINEKPKIFSSTSPEDYDKDQQEVHPSISRPHGFPPPEVAFVSLVDGQYKVRGRLVLRAPAATVYSLLTDYGACQRVFSNIAASEVLRTASGDLEVIQSCKWTFLAFSGTFKVHLGVAEVPATGSLTFRLVHSNFMQDFQGCWTVKPMRPRREVAAAAEAEGGPQEHTDSGGDDDGGGGFNANGWEDGEWCEVQHELAVVPAVPVPPPVSYYTRSIFVRQVEGILLDLQRGVMAAVAVERD